jgi:hypothetical protein
MARRRISVATDDSTIRLLGLDGKSVSEIVAMCERFERVGGPDNALVVDMREYLDSLTIAPAGFERHDPVTRLFGN